MAKICQLALVLATAASMPFGGPSATASEPALLSFDSLNGLECQPNYKCVKAAAELDAEHRREGTAAVKVTWSSADDNYGVVHLVAAIPETDFTGKTVTFSLMPLDANGSVWGVEFHDADGNRVEEHRVYHVAAGKWNAIRFDQGQKAKDGWIRRGTGNLKRITRLIFRAQTKGGGQTAAALWDDLRVFKAVPPGRQPVSEKIKRAPDVTATPATVSRGDTAVWLDADAGYALAGMRLAGCRLEPSVGHPYPRFTFMDTSGATKTMACTDPAWQIKAAAEGEGAFGVVYSHKGTAMKVLWTATDDAIRCDVSVVSEGDLNAAAAGAARLFGTVLGEADYGIPPTGFLPHYTKDPVRIQGAPKLRTPLFIAARVGGRILYYKPLTAAQQMTLCLRKAGDNRLAWMGGTVYFRPREFKDPKTKLCHKTLSWKVETAGDVNADGTVDWVDCGIAYRERYIQPNRHKSRKLRDSFRYYHPLYKTPSYGHLLELVEKIDFATGVWWMKGMMKTNRRPVSEAHPFKVEPYAEAGDLSQVKPQLLAAGALIGPYYGHDYINMLGGNWPESLIKIDPSGAPHKYYQLYGHPLYYKDNVRGLATGDLKRHYEAILNVCRLQPGDTIMLDTFTAYARPGYHRDYPATVHTEVEAKHELARWLKDDKGLVVAAEGIVEGTQDVVDYSAIASDLRRTFVASRQWNQGWVPLKAVVFNGSTYFGCSWYAVRNPGVNYAAALLDCLGLWEWSTLSQNHPEHMFAKTARDFFLQQIFWSRIADHKITDVDRKGIEYTLRFENGSVLCVDPERETYWLEENGIRYDGFTPFNSKGVMAVIRQGDIDIVLPVKEMLEIIPSQPNREGLLKPPAEGQPPPVEITRAPDGRIRIKGNFSRFPFRLIDYRNEKAPRWIDAPPVLMLRRAKREGAPK